MQEIRVSIREQERNYPICIEGNIRQEAARLIGKIYQGDRIFLVTDQLVNELYGEEVIEILQNAGYQVFSYILPQGEEAKSFKYLQQGFDLLIENDFKRDNIILALGGGVVGDLAGFLAASFMRGIPFVQLPTTLLAQVDSSVGGKTAINHPRGKNLIGAFQQPELVIIDPYFLKTLSREDFNNGMAEVIKHGFIADHDYTHFLQDNKDNIQTHDIDVLAEMIYLSCQIKSKVVMQDEKEQGVRAYLNFGHTVGHALEAVTNFKYYKHGQAVAIGMSAAARLADKLSYLDRGIVEFIEEMIRSYGLPTRLQHNEDIDDIFERLFYDKKVKHGKIRWVLLKGIGQPLILEDIDEGIIKEVLEGLQ